MAGTERDATTGASAPLSRGLSTRLLLLTIFFVLIAEILIFLPSIADFKRDWLRDRLSMAATASLVLLAADFDEELPPEVRDDVLLAIGAKAVAIREEGESRLLVVTDVPISVDEHVDLDENRPLPDIAQALATLIMGGDHVLRVFGAIGGPGREFELILEDGQLRRAMLTYSGNVALLSLIISLFTASLVTLAIDRMMIRPIRRMTRAMLAFSQDPENPARIIRASGRKDEIGIAEEELAEMQQRLSTTLAEQKHLADLGLAVAKINHDLRNILAPAQLLSDRLAALPDPSVQAVVPKLIRTIDRAIAYSEDVLAYGKAQEAPPQRRRLRLRQIVDEVYELLAIGHERQIEFQNNVPADFEVDADSDQLFRVLLNLCRNSVQAMAADSSEAVIRRLTVDAGRAGSIARILVEDTGPGLPKAARENLFAAFRGSAKSGGTGLGLAIAHELVRAHGGNLDLVESTGGKTLFAISLPERPVLLEARRDAMRLRPESRA